jgi:hypothetical protein
MTCRLNRRFLTFLASIAFVLLGLAMSTAAQTACPENMVCLTPAAARAALEAGDRAKALQVENDELKTKVIPQLKDALADMRIQYAECKGETTILKQRAVSDAAMIELLSKIVRPKKFGAINF